MKVRDGFVSNSSTTSFVVFGASLERRAFYDLFDPNGFDQKTIDKLYQYSNNKPTIEKFKQHFDILFKEDLEDYYELTSLLEEQGLAAESGYEGESFYVGLSPSPDVAKFKGEDILIRMKRSADKIQDIHNIINDCKFFTEKGKKLILKKLGWHLEAWRDG